MRFRDAFGYSYFIKRLLFLAFGPPVWYRHFLINKTKVEGADKLRNLPREKVLFVSNHQTYFADVAFLYLLFCATKNNFKSPKSFPIYLFNPRLKVYFIAAVETMKAGLLPKLFAYAGSISIKRTWRESGKDINRQVDLRDISNIGRALDFGWVITFPQGTTSPFVPGRKGTVHIIKKYNPIVVPVVIDGFRRGFDKKGLFLKKKGVNFSVRIKDPLNIPEDTDKNKVMEIIMDAIEQSEKFQEPIRNIKKKKETV